MPFFPLRKNWISAFFATFSPCFQITQHYHLGIIWVSDRKCQAATDSPFVLLHKRNKRRARQGKVDINFSSSFEHFLSDRKTTIKDIYALLWQKTWTLLRTTHTPSLWLRCLPIVHHQIKIISSFSTICTQQKCITGLSWRNFLKYGNISSSFT
jgi:hypothetical protein